jgi:hypothetical protein
MNKSNLVAFNLIYVLALLFLHLLIIAVLGPHLETQVILVAFSFAIMSFILYVLMVVLNVLFWRFDVLDIAKINRVLLMLYFIVSFFSVLETIDNIKQNSVFFKIAYVVLLLITFFYPRFFIKKENSET